MLMRCLSGCVAGQVRQKLAFFCYMVFLCLCRESLERVEVARAGFRFICYFLLVLAPFGF
jgi:hypothetical protein